MGSQSEDFNEETDYTEGQDDAPAAVVDSPEGGTEKADDQAEGEGKGEGEGDNSAEGDEPDPAKPPRVEFSPEQQEKFDAEVRRRAAKTAEAKQEYEQERRRREEVEQELAKFKQPQRPTLPPAPDRWDDDYDEKQAEYNQALQEQIRYDAQQDFHRQQQEAIEQRKEQEDQQKQIERVNRYQSRVEKLGVDKAVLREAGPAVATVLNNQALVDYLLEDEVGPLITEYLYKHPAELESLAGIGPVRAGEILYDIKAKAKAARTRVKPDPKPLDNPAGIGMGEANEDDKWGTYE